MLLLCPPGVYRAERDTSLLAAMMRRSGYAAGRDVLDVGTGTGALAIAAAREGASSVTAVDLSTRAVAATWLNSRLHRAGVTVHRGDLFAPVAGRRFGLVVANPPYVPSETALLPRHRRARSWDGGIDGRAVIDRICADVEQVLAPDGDVLLVHSAVCHPDRTVARLQEAGLAARVVASARIPFGPVMRARTALLEARGLIAPGERIEELVVVGARRV
jgi:release factor glutamine methyltransferase